MRRQQTGTTKKRAMGRGHRTDLEQPQPKMLYDYIAEEESKTVEQLPLIEDLSS